MVYVQSTICGFVHFNRARKPLQSYSVACREVLIFFVLYQTHNRNTSIHGIIGWWWIYSLTVLIKFDHGHWWFQGTGLWEWRWTKIFRKLPPFCDATTCQTNKKLWPKQCRNLFPRTQVIDILENWESLKAMKSYEDEEPKAGEKPHERNWFHDPHPPPLWNTHPQRHIWWSSPYTQLPTTKEKSLLEPPQITHTYIYIYIYYNLVKKRI